MIWGSSNGVAWADPWVDHGAPVGTRYPDDRPAHRPAPEGELPEGGLPDGVRDRRGLRDVLGRFATGVTVLTAGRAVPSGMTANSFTSVSLDPPLVLVCVGRTASMHREILDGGSFGVCVLAAGQLEAARHFADRARPRGERGFELVDWRPGRHTGVPIVSGALAWIECRLAAVYDGGDHSIFLGAALEVGRAAAGDPLVFFGGGFRALAAEPGPEMAERGPRPGNQ